MTKSASSFSAAAIMLGVVLHAGGAGATGPTLVRTWVSGATGLDTNPCTRAQPCATLQHAYDATSPSGEIDVIDGGDFGSIAIFKAITVANDGAGTAAITFNGGSGLVVSAGASDAVVLRGLSFNGIGVNGPLSDGIDFFAGASLLIDHCEVQGFYAGVKFAPNQANGKLSIKDTVLSNNGPYALLVAPSGFTATAELERVQILNPSGNGVRVDASAGPADVELHDVTVDGASGGSAIVALSQTSGGPSAKLLADHVTSSHNVGYGFRAVGGTASVYLRRSVAENNGVGLGVSSGGQIFSYGDNSVANNTGGAGVTPTAVASE